LKPCSTDSGVLEGISVDVPTGCDNGQVHRQLNLVRENIGRRLGKEEMTGGIGQIGSK
jgi:hypothetical protein